MRHRNTGLKNGLSFLPRPSGLCYAIFRENFKGNQSGEKRSGGKESKEERPWKDPRDPKVCSAIKQRVQQSYFRSILFSRSIFSSFPCHILLSRVSRALFRPFARHRPWLVGPFQECTHTPTPLPRRTRGYLSIRSNGSNSRHRPPLFPSPLEHLALASSDHVLLSIFQVSALANLDPLTETHQIGLALDSLDQLNSA